MKKIFILLTFGLLSLGAFAQNYSKQQIDSLKILAELLKILAEKGDAEAQLNLGYCYDMGKGVAEDKAEAVKWYRKAADQGDTQAQYNLGVCYCNGDGVTQN